MLSQVMRTIYSLLYRCRPLTTATKCVSSTALTYLFCPFLPQVSHCLSEILELCNSFSSLLHQRDDLTLSADDRATVDRIAKVQ